MTASDGWESRRQEVRDAVQVLGQTPRPARKARTVAATPTPLTAIASSIAAADTGSSPS